MVLQRQRLSVVNIENIYMKKTEDCSHRTQSNPIQSNPWMDPIHVQLWDGHTKVVFSCDIHVRASLRICRALYICRPTCAALFRVKNGRTSKGPRRFLSVVETACSLINDPVGATTMNREQPADRPTKQQSHVIFAGQSIIPHTNGLFVHNLLGDASAGSAESAKCRPLTAASPDA